MEKFPNKHFVHLHVHSDYSQFDGLVSVPNLVMEARKMGFPALALTDHGTMGGCIKFIRECKKTKDKKGNKIKYPPIKPIVGFEAYFGRYLKGNKENQPDGQKGNHHLLLLAKNWEGYKNLCRLQTLSWTEGFYYSPRIDIRCLADHSEGLLCGSACLAGIINYNLRRGRYNQAKKAVSILKEIFGDDFFLEIMYHGIVAEYIIASSILKLGKELDVPVVATNDVHYLHKDDALSQEVLMCMGRQTCLSDPNHGRHSYPELYLKSAKEMGKIFGDYPEVVYNTVAIANRIDAKDIDGHLFGKMRLPKYEIPPEFDSPMKYLTHLAKQGMIKKGWDKSEKHIKRLKRELLDVKTALEVNELDFPTYFLVVRDYVNWAKANEIMVAPGRGSGYGSILLHCLDICSGVDPLRYGLLWQRFLGFDFSKYIKYKDLGIKRPDNPCHYKLSYDDMKKRILTQLDTRNQRFNDELFELENTSGLNGKNNLEIFYEIYRYCEDSNIIGNENKINSLLAYNLRMTDKKPSGNFLSERRVYARAGYPDIDTDFCYFRREEVINYKKKKYGEEYTAHIGTYGTMGLRAAITRVAKALDIAKAFHKGPVEYKSLNVQKVNEILEPIPKVKGILQTKNPKTGENIKIKTIKDAIKCYKDFSWYMNDQYPDLNKHAQAVEGLIQNFTVHAAGVIVSGDPLCEIVPIIRCANGYATQYPNEDLEEMGILKFDDLGVSTLTTIDETLKLIKANYGIDLNLNDIPIDDEATYKMYQKGNLDGVFQCEEAGMQAVIKQIRPTRFEDIMAANALVRPGPSAFVPQYCSCKEGRSKPDYFHPSIEKLVKPYLEETYGIIVYQESIMQICNALAGFSITNGYIMIKAVGKKKEVLLKRFKEQFISGCVKNNVPEKIAESYWDKCIIPFADYGFNRSHACSYSLTSFRSCYLKTHYPEEYMVSLLNVENLRKKFDLVEKYENNLLSCGIKLGAKEINKCGVKYKIIKKADRSKGRGFSIISPTLVVKGVGENSAQEIEDNAPYYNLKDLAEVASKAGTAIKKDTIGCLYDGGFFRGYIQKRQKETGQKLDREGLVGLFDSYRKDFKVAAAKGVISQNLFED